MAFFSEKIQKGDWKAEKHVPVILAPDAVKPGEAFEVTVNIGEEIAHPNTTEHHIRYIQLYFFPEGDKFVYEVGRYDFSAHGEAVAGANQGPVYSEPHIVAKLKVNKPGVLQAVSFCNIHGFWESKKEIKLS